MKIFTCITAVLFFTITSNAQITKGNWMVGGNASYSSYKSKSLSAENPTLTTVELKPNIGYFIIDKLAGGIILDILNSKQKYHLPDGSMNKTSQTALGFGPFLRYYLLDTDKMVNVFLSANLIRRFVFAYTNSEHTTTSNSFSYEGAAGAVVFLNSSVGLEAAVGYNHIADIANDNDAKANQILFRLGFQIHLEK